MKSNSDGPTKILIYECSLKTSGHFDWENSIFCLEQALEEEAVLQKWCPDWVYEILPTDEETVFDIKVYGQFEDG